MKFLELYIGCFIMWIAAYYVGRILFEEKKKHNIFKIGGIMATAAMLLTCINMLDSEVISGTLRILCIYVLQCLFYKVTFNKSLEKTLVVSLILYLCICVFDVVIVLTVSVLSSGNNTSIVFFRNNIVINTLVSLFIWLFIKLTKHRLITLVQNSKLEGKGNIMLIFIILITLALLAFKTPMSNWNFNMEYIATMVLLLCFCIVGIFMLKQRADIHKTTSMYQQLAEYSDITNNVLEEYRVVTHEHKNQLLIIRSMLENKDKEKEINDYIDNLLEKREGIKYKWIGELNHLPLSGLKGLINYKILEMDTLKLNKVITISKEVSKLKLERLSIKQKDNLYSIIGIYLDNAIQAAKESKTKEINLEIYKEDKELVIVLANTYKEEIDLEKMDEYGYTTKGKNHGMGLHIVKNILQNDPTFNSRKYIIDNYFVQEIRIDLNKIKTK